MATRGASCCFCFTFMVGSATVLRVLPPAQQQPCTDGRLGKRFPAACSSSSIVLFFALLRTNALRTVRLIAVTLILCACPHNLCQCVVALMASRAERSTRLLDKMCCDASSKSVHRNVPNLRVDYLLTYDTVLFMKRSFLLIVPRACMQCIVAHEENSA